MKILIDHGANVNYQTHRGVTALWLAVPDWDKTILLLEHGADVQHKVEGYGILVKLAAIPGSIKIFRLLIDRGADPKKSSADNLILYNAGSGGDTAIIGFLLRTGLNPNEPVSFGDYPINAAINYRNSCVKMFVKMAPM
jgi:ankyrin repeat protein